MRQICSLSPIIVSSRNPLAAYTFGYVALQREEQICFMDGALTRKSSNHDMDGRGLKATVPAILCLLHAVSFTYDGIRPDAR